MKLRNKDTGEDGRLMMCHDYDEFPFFIEIGSIKIYYHNFADMVEAGWDCAKIPAEPLIKDEKIRKAIRAWWETIPDVITDKRILFKKYNDFAVGVYTIYCGAIYPETLEVGKMYTIAELCGEEEE